MYCAARQILPNLAQLSHQVQSCHCDVCPCFWQSASGAARISSKRGPSFRGAESTSYQKRKTHRIWHTFLWERRGFIKHTYTKIARLGSRRAERDHLVSDSPASGQQGHNSGIREGPMAGLNGPFSCLRGPPNSGLRKPEKAHPRSEGVHLRPDRAHSWSEGCLERSESSQSAPIEYPEPPREGSWPMRPLTLGYAPAECHFHGLPRKCHERARRQMRGHFDFQWLR